MISEPVLEWVADADEAEINEFLVELRDALVSAGETASRAEYLTDRVAVEAQVAQPYDSYDPGY